jgi:hypothetical protein
MFADFHPITRELYVAEFYNPPLGATPDSVSLSRVAYDAAGNLTLAQGVQLNQSPFGATRTRNIRFTADAGFLALPGYFDQVLGPSECFAHWEAPGSAIPPVGDLNTSCGTPFPSDARGFAPRPEGGPLFYYQSGSTLDAAEFQGGAVVSHTTITPVHPTNQLQLAFGGRVLVSLGPAADEVVTYDVAADLVTLTPIDAAPVGAGPDSGVLIPCPDI